jgi:nucleoid DNA-binding protein
MKKKELIERIAKEAGAPKSETQKHFEAFEEVVTEALKAGEEVSRSRASGSSLSRSARPGRAGTPRPGRR